MFNSQYNDDHVVEIEVLNLCLGAQRRCPRRASDKPRSMAEVTPSISHYIFRR